MALVAPWWMGYFFVSPLRRLMENPEKTVSGLVAPGMTVLEPGPAMGFFTLPLARMVGEEGKVVAVDLQERMLKGLRRRAAKAGLMERIETRLSSEGCLNIADLAEGIDLALALYVVHEVPDQLGFFSEIYEVLKPGGKLLVVEPKGHVKPEDFEKSLELGKEAGFIREPGRKEWGVRSALLLKMLEAA